MGQEISKKFSKSSITLSEILKKRREMVPITVEEMKLYMLTD